MGSGMNQTMVQPSSGMGTNMGVHQPSWGMQQQQQPQMGMGVGMQQQMGMGMGMQPVGVQGMYGANPNMYGGSYQTSAMNYHQMPK
jgi:hypothetical protein